MVTCHKQFIIGEKSLKNKKSKLGKSKKTKTNKWQTAIVEDHHGAVVTPDAAHQVIFWFDYLTC